jgi:UDP-2,3-diacylglucosamine pyrophosphatase LpxH
MTDHSARALLLEFNKPIDPRTLDGNIYLHDKTGNLSEMHTVKLDPEDLSHKRVILEFKNDFYLNESWKYTIFINRNVRSILGRSLPNTLSFEVYTNSRSPFDAPVTGTGDGKRSKIVVISDIHMNEQRGYEDGYSLFTENAKLLEDFLESVRVSDTTKELMILGDLLDMWVIPMAYHTFRDNINDNKAYFHSVSEANINKAVIAKINQIADEGKIHFTYVPGNHDMLFTEDIFYSIFPNGHWQGTEPGTGIYFPEASVVLEHGHNYDLYNAPDSVTTAGSLLPPGYFITRIYATGNLLSSTKLPLAVLSTEGMDDELIYTSSWDLAVASINLPDFDPIDPQIYTHVDGYTQLYSTNEARDIYTQNIASHWEERQIINGVHVPNSVIVGIMNGSGKFLWFGTLEYSAIAQYFTKDPQIHIVVFGHTHHALLKQNWETLDNIYANSGTWVDKKYLNDGALTGTCVVLNTAASSGSDLDSVTLYQAVRGSTGKIDMKTIDEKHLDTTLDSHL